MGQCASKRVNNVVLSVVCWYVGWLVYVAALAVYFMCMYILWLLLLLCMCVYNNMKCNVIMYMKLYCFCFLHLTKKILAEN